MKLKNIAVATIVLGTLFGCSKKSEYKTAIDNSLRDHHECIARVDTSGMTLKKNDLAPFEAKHAYVIALKPKDKLSAHEADTKAKLDAMVDAGLLSLSSEDVAVKGWFDIKSDYTLYLYDYTSKAREYLQSDNLHGTGPETKVLCYADLGVDSIINYTEQGDNQATVKYSYKYVSVANWANNDKMKKSFPNIQKTLDTKDKTTTATLIKTDNGWQTSL